MVTQPEADEPVDEAHGHGLDVDSIFGVRVVRDPDAAAYAQRLADESGGEILRDLQHARRAFAARAEAGRVEPVVLNDAERAELESSANAPEDADPAVTEVATLELQQLADELVMTERIRADTEAGMTAFLNRRLSAASAVAIHPSTIRQAAAAVTEAEATVAACDADVAALGERPAAEGIDGEPAPVPATPPAGDRGPDEHADQRDEPAPTRDGRAVALAIVIGVVFAAAAVALVLVGVSVGVPIAVFVVGLVLAFVFFRRSRRDGRSDRSGEPTASAPAGGDTEHERAGASASTPSPDGPQSSVAEISEDEWVARRAHIDAVRERATERLRSARRHWDSLVGPDADPHAVDEVLRVRDPQLELVGAASKKSPTVRTVSAVHRRTRARWRVAWAAVGYDEPPPLDEVDAHLERLRASGGEAAEAARERLRAAHAWSDACRTIDRPLVLVEPEEWLPKDILESMLNSLPAGAEVIVVEPDGTEVAESAEPVAVDASDTAEPESDGGEAS
jgi:hypothetical protein